MKKITNGFKISWWKIFIKCKIKQKRNRVKKYMRCIQNQT